MEQSRKDTNTKERVYSLDFIRVIACIGICWLHYRLFLCPQGIFFGDRMINEEACGWELKFFVEVFFGLSGYLSYHQIEKIRQGMPFSQYYRKKLIRILPMLAIGTIFYEVMVGIMIGNGRCIRNDFYAPTLWGILSSCFGVQEGWGFISTWINVESWYLDVLLLCFAFFYFTVWLSKKLDINTAVVFAVMVIIGCTASSYALPIPFFNDQDGRGYESFFAGVLLAGYVARNGVHRKEVIVSFAVLLTYGMYHIFWPDLLFFGRYHLMALFVPPALILLMESSVMKRLFFWAGWGNLGKITFCTYVFHVGLIFAIYNIETKLDLTIDYAHEVMLIAFIIAAFILGALLHFAVERPLTRMLAGRRSEERSK